MTWSGDPELERMFREEITTRAAALVEGSVAYAAREHDDALLEDLHREAHTVKGTSRVMGHPAIGNAGELLERTWRLVASGDLSWDPDVADALLSLAEVLPDAIDGDPDEGTFELADAVEILEATLADAGIERASSSVSERPVDVTTGTAAAPSHETAAQSATATVERPTVAAPQVAQVAHEAPPELSAHYDPTFDEDEGPSTLDILRARSAQRAIAEVEAAAGADGVPDGGDVGDVIVETTRPTIEHGERETTPATTPARRRRRRDDRGQIDIANLQALNVVDRPDVGGLLGAVQDWATGESASVNTGRLYELINGIAALRVEAETVLQKAQSERLATGYDGGGLTGLIATITAQAAILERQSVELTAVPLETVLSTMPQLVGFVARKLGKEVTFETTGGDVLVDRAVIDAIGDPIRQLVVNAVLHGIEAPDDRTAAGKAPTGRVTVDIKALDGQIQVTVADDGGGIDWDEVGSVARERGLVDADTSDPKVLLGVLFSEGFSTVDRTELGGSGDGLSGVASAIEALLGRLSLRSEPGRGSIARFTVPTSRALQRLVIIEDGGLRWGLPDAAVDQIIPLAQANIDWNATQPQLSLRTGSVPLYAISQVVGGGTANLSEVIVVSHRTETVAFAVGAVDAVREVATKELGPLLQGPKHITGAALLGGGDLVLVLDPYELVERARRGESSGTLNGPRLLVVDDSAGVRAVVTAALSSSGFVTSAVDTVADAIEHLASHHVDAVVVDFQMPGEDGISLVRKIRAEDAALPVVMLSAVADDEDQKAALEAGANAVLDKADVREGALAATLHHLVAAAAQSEAAAGSASSS